MIPLTIVAQKHYVVSPATPPPPLLQDHSWPQTDETALTRNNSGIFGYINYLVEKDRKYILNTLINGKLGLHCFCVQAAGAPPLTAVRQVSSV